MGFSVDKVASLAYLQLSEAERALFESQFKEILGYVDQLQKIPMTEAEAQSMGAFHVQTRFYEISGLEFGQSLRDEDQKDEELDSLNLSNEEALSNAPKKEGLPGELLFEVPSIIER